MTSVPRWEPDGTESPAERTDPLIPAITDDMVPPRGLPRPPTLDARTLERMLAELEPDEPQGSGAGERDASPKPGGASPDPAGAVAESMPVAESEPVAESSPAAGPGLADRTRSVSPPAEPDRARQLGPSRVFGMQDRDREQERAERPLRLVEHPGGPVGHWPASTGKQPTSKYVRRDARPPEVHADALSLTGLTRRSRSRVGSILFTVAFVGVFVLIVVQAIVSLVTPGG